MTIEKFTADTFSETLNTKFRLSLPEEDVVELELFEVENVGSTARQERFSLLFRGPLERAVRQGSYSFEHEKLGTFDLFIVPIGMREDGVIYEAAFNRIKKG